MRKFPRVPLRPRTGRWNLRTENDVWHGGFCDAANHELWTSAEPPRRRKPRRTSSSTSTTPSTGTRGAPRRSRRARRRGQADLPLRRLQHLLLVPRHGAAELRERSGRGGDERAVRQHQGRPRGAAGRRPALHDGGAGADAARRVADERVAHAGPAAVLRRHVLPADRPARPAGVRHACCAALDDAYRNRRDDVEQTGEQLAGHPRSSSPSPRRRTRPIAIDDAFVDELVERSTRDYDPRYGGFGGAPKFPRETLLELLLVPTRRRRVADAIGSRRSASMLLHTLDAMADGGIRDHLGGGFHRYSTDAKWLVPHFEIMLYDNAMLAWCYAEAFRQTRRASATPQVARGVFDFVLREMTSPGRGVLHRVRRGGGRAGGAELPVDAGGGRSGARRATTRSCSTASTASTAGPTSPTRTTAPACPTRTSCSSPTPTADGEPALLDPDARRDAAEALRRAADSASSRCSTRRSSRAGTR